MSDLNEGQGGCCHSCGCGGKSDSDKKLTVEEYHVLREKGTEPAFTSSLYLEKRNGLYLCKGCGAALFSSEHKYDSGSGWPSFFAPVSDDVIGTSVDHKIGYERVEIHCAKCNGHLGHVFDDGPKPTGLRFCVNGLSLEFKAE